jgi:hypothetical protein
MNNPVGSKLPLPVHRFARPSSLRWAAAGLSIVKQCVGRLREDWPSWPPNDSLLARNLLFCWLLAFADVALRGSNERGARGILPCVFPRVPRSLETIITGSACSGKIVESFRASLAQRNDMIAFPLLVLFWRCVKIEPAIFASEVSTQTNPCLFIRPFAGGNQLSNNPFVVLHRSLPIGIRI